MNPAPVALFAYNRPEHTGRTLRALSRNEGASSTTVFVYSDGPKGEQDEPAVEEVRAECRRVKGFADLKLIARPENVGLAANISGGVTETIDRFGRIVVLEDDNVTSPYFLRYMNEALMRYEDEPRVMHIAGFMYPIEPNGLPETFFYRVPTCSGGWATWRRAWRLFRRDPQTLGADFSPQDIVRFNVDGATSHWQQVEQNRDGRLNTWAIFWYAAIFKHNGLCLHPAQSLVSNIGFDGTGVHCTTSRNFDVRVRYEPIRSFPRADTEHPIALERIRAFHCSPKRPWWQRKAQKLKRRFVSPPPLPLWEREPIPRQNDDRADLFISIVTGTLNRRSLLPRVIANTVEADPRLELVLVDGGSTDGTVDYLRTLDHPRIRVVEVGERSSYPHFMNLGIRAARHEYVCQWNDDVLLHNPWDDVFREIDGSAAYIFAWKKARFPRRPGNRNWVLHQTVARESPGEIVMNFGVYHKDVFRKIGLYNPAYRFYYADADMSYRTWSFGLKVKCCPNIRAVVPRGVPKSFNHVDADKSTYDEMREIYRTGRLPDTLEYLR